MTDIFDHTITCRECGKKMNLVKFSKNGFVMRAVVCPSCDEKLIHPGDEAEYRKFINLKNKEFHVKMRLVGNSYAVSIPREIVSFMEQQEQTMNEMVSLCFQDIGRLSLDFGMHDESASGEKTNSRIVKAREYKVIKNNKPVLHIKQFADSANPKNNKTQVFKNTDQEEKGKIK